MRIEYTAKGLEVIINPNKNKRMVPNVDEFLERIYVIKHRTV